MKVRLIAVVLLLFAGIPATAQSSALAEVVSSAPVQQVETQQAAADTVAAFKVTYSIEVGTGFPPLTSGSYDVVRHKLSREGKMVNKDGSFSPVISVAGVIRSGVKTEVAFVAGVV